MVRCSYTGNSFRLFYCQDQISIISLSVRNNGSKLLPLTNIIITEVENE